MLKKTAGLPFTGRALKVPELYAGNGHVQFFVGGYPVHALENQHHHINENKF